MTILDEICQHQQKLVDQLKISKPVEELTLSPYFQRKGISLKEKFRTTQGAGIIAEFKRKSPSKSNINLNVNPLDVVTAYEKAGAFACSILTNEKFFGGTDQDVLDVRERLSIPILRKEFILDPYQVYETKALGADVMLLIAAAMSRDTCLELAMLAKSIGLEVFLELRDDEEAGHINPFCDFIGVNNRDLKTFEVDVKVSEAMSRFIPEKNISVSESGISDPETVKHLMNYGFRGFLMGEHFMAQEDPGAACQKFMDSIQG